MTYLGFQGGGAIFLWPLMLSQKRAMFSYFSLYGQNWFFWPKEGLAQCPLPQYATGFTDRPDSGNVFDQLIWNLIIPSRRLIFYAHRSRVARLCFYKSGSINTIVYSGIVYHRVHESLTIWCHPIQTRLSIVIICCHVDVVSQLNDNVVEMSENSIVKVNVLLYNYGTSVVFSYKALLLFFHVMVPLFYHSIWLHCDSFN